MSVETSPVNKTILSPFRGRWEPIAFGYAILAAGTGMSAAGIIRHPIVFTGFFVLYASLLTALQRRKASSIVQAGPLRRGERHLIFALGAGPVFALIALLLTGIAWVYMKGNDPGFLKR